LIKEFPEFKPLVRENQTLVVKLKGALYGLPESGRLWFEELSQFFFQTGYEQSMEDPCVFDKMDGEDKIIIDDGIHIATSQHLINGLITERQKKFGKITHQQGKKISFSMTGQSQSVNLDILRKSLVNTGVLVMQL
jgi:hypothetical protein